MSYYRCLQLRGLRCCASSCFLVASIVLIVFYCFTYLNEMFSKGIVSVCRHPVTVGTIMHHLQGFSGRATARLNAIESQQNILDGKLSSDPLGIEDIVTQVHWFCESIRHCEPLRVQIGSRAPQHYPIVQCGGLGSASSMW
jgi:hypothetical protein